MKSKLDKEFEAVWKSRDKAGHFWNQGKGTFKPHYTLKFVPRGDALFTRKIKEFARYIVLQKNDFGRTSSIGFLANAKKVDRIIVKIKETEPERKQKRELREASKQKKYEKILEERKEIRDKKHREFCNKYGGWSGAVFEVCEGLFNLNRFAKHLDRNDFQHEHIYSLKNKLIRWLYENGFCIATWKHIHELDEKECWNCEGDGHTHSGECKQCCGTGVFQPSIRLRFGCFKFNINGNIYVWHQPEETIKFQVEYTEPEEELKTLPEKKEVPMGEDQLEEMLELIEWFVENATSGRDEFSVN